MLFCFISNYLFCYTTGYIVVTVDNNGQKYMAEQRAVKTCDFSGKAFIFLM